MKKIVFAVLAALLFMPVVSHAGDVTSRYDVTFGGYIKMDLGYATQNSSADRGYAWRSSSSTMQSLNDEYGNTYMAVGDTHLNFLVKGPDAFGAKTSAFIDLDFVGATTGNAYGGAELYHGFIKLNWTNTELIIGHTWQQFGMIYDRGVLGRDDFITEMKGVRFPQVTVRHDFTKNFDFMVGIFSPTDWGGSTRQFNDDYARNGLPYLQYELEYKNSNYKLGSNIMRFALGGYIGREKKTNTFNGLTYKDDTVPSWITAFRFYVPIIPEKQGNKKNGLSFNGNFFIGQNMAGNNWVGGSGKGTPSDGSYWRSDGTAAAPTLYGGFGQLSYYVTNNVWINGAYGFVKYNFSNWARSTSPYTGSVAADMKGYEQLNWNQQWALNIFYDPSPSLRLGAEWTHIFTRWNGPSNTSAVTGTPVGEGYLDKDGSLDMYRVAAWYFF